MSVNTHSVDLSQFDLKEIITLEYNGKIEKPISAFSLQGHHSNGKLLFNVKEELTLFSVIIDGIPKVNKRVFTWEKED